MKRVLRRSAGPTRATQPEFAACIRLVAVLRPGPNVRPELGFRDASLKTGIKDRYCKLSWCVTLGQVDSDDSGLIRTHVRDSGWAGNTDESRSPTGHTDTVIDRRLGRGAPTAQLRRNPRAIPSVKVVSPDVRLQNVARPLGCRVLPTGARRRRVRDSGAVPASAMIAREVSGLP